MRLPGRQTVYEINTAVSLERWEDLPGATWTLGDRLSGEQFERDGDDLPGAAGAGSAGIECAVATERGMARIGERGPGGPSLERLLQQHAESAAPIREG